MHIIGLEVSNIKRLHAIEIDASGKNFIQITGRNGQGKTSVIDSIWYGIVGKKAMPDMPVRHGAQNAKVRLRMGEILLTRTITADGNMRLKVETGDGVEMSNPQAFLDELWSELTFDPLEFVRMKPKEQVEVLKGLVGLNFDDMKLATKEDFDRRRDINKEIDKLKAEIARIPEQQGLPAHRIDEDEIRARMAQLNEENKKARQLDDDKKDLESALTTARAALWQQKHTIEVQTEAIAVLRQRLAAEEKKLEAMQEPLDNLQKIHNETEGKWFDAPAGVYPDFQALTQELQQAQLINREISKRELREQRVAELKLEQDKSNALTRAMDQREEKKQLAIENAEMPIKGLRFDDDGATYMGIPIDQLGEGEQIRVSTSIAMAGNPQLRILRIMHGEALDPAGIAMLKQMAIEHDFQIWMAMVETSGKVGIVIEDGQIEVVNKEPEHDGQKTVGAEKRGGRRKGAGVGEEADGQ